MWHRDEESKIPGQVSSWRLLPALLNGPVGKIMSHRDVSEVVGYGAPRVESTSQIVR